MIVLDGIIYDLQRAGGISVYFNEVLRGCAERHGLQAELILSPESANLEQIRRLGLPLEVQSPRNLERLRPVNLPAQFESGVFLSSYYRRPKKSARTVVTVHDFIHRRFGTGIRNHAFIFQQTAAIKTASWIICVSESTRRDLLEFFPRLDPSRVSVIYNGVSEAFYKSRPADRERAVAVVGSRRGHKNFEQAVRAMRHLPEYMLEIVGGGPLSNEEQSLLEVHCPGRYRTHGYLDEASLNDIYNRSRALLYLSNYEGFGIPPLEAMRAGCVPIVKNNSSLPEVVGEAGLYVGTEPEDVAERVLSLEDNRVALRLSESGLSQVAKFNWKMTRERTVDLLMQVASDPALDAIGPALRV